jgi:transposase, IS5 family
LEELGRIVDFEDFRVILDNALAYSDGKKGGRPPYDPVAMFKILILAAQNKIADARMEYLIRDRLSWLRFLGFDLGAPTPDANTMRLFGERLTDAKVITVLFDAFDNRLRTNGYLAMGGTDCRCHTGGGTQAAQHAGGEGRDQSRQDSRRGLAR